MKRTIFYSWQSDLDNRTNRTFIQNALERAVNEIRSDETVDIEPVVDRDTKGLSGSPDIGQSILEKINHADVFLCDVSTINSGMGGRRTPNPNVLFELGYAWKTLGPERVILVLNSAYGGPEELPFDLRGRRAVKYKYSNEENVSSIRSMLSKQLALELRNIFAIDHVAVQQRNPDRPYLIINSGGSEGGPLGHFFSLNVANLGRSVALNIEIAMTGLSKTIKIPVIEPGHPSRTRIESTKERILTDALSDPKVSAKYKDVEGNRYLSQAGVTQEKPPGGGFYELTIGETEHLV